MGNRHGILACGGVMLAAHFGGVQLPAWGPVLVYLAVSLLSQAFGGTGGASKGQPAKPLDDTVSYLQGADRRAQPGTPGKVVVIERWATWCPPCVRSIPHLNGVYNKYKSRSDFQLVGVTDENDPPKIKAFMAKHGMQYPVAIDTRGCVASAYPSNGIPNATIVGRDGNVWWNGHPMSMDAPLAECIAKSTAGPASAATQTKTPHPVVPSQAGAAAARDDKANKGD